MSRTSQSLALRYAKALLALGQDAAAREALGEQLARTVQLFSALPELTVRLGSPLLDRQARLELARELASRLELGPELSGFLALLVRRGRISLLTPIQEAFGRLLDLEAGLVRAKVRMASPLAPDQRLRLETQLARLGGARVLCEYETDASLLGGCVVRLDDLLLDGSLKGRLARLRRSLLETGQVED